MDKELRTEFTVIIMTECSGLLDVLDRSEFEPSEGWQCEANNMPLTVSDKLLKTLEVGRRPVVVRDGRTKKDYAVMSEQVYARARPLIEFVSNDGARPSDGDTESWTDEKNARRAALINKKHDSKLTSAETRELNQLTEEVRQYQERVVPIHNHALELILEALDRRAQEAARNP